MKKFLVVGIMLIGLAFVVSCATAPKKVPAPMKEEVAAPDAEYAQAKELRATIMKYGLDSYAQNEFRKAEKSFKDGETAYGKQNDKAKAAFTDAIAGYRTVVNTGFPAYLDAKIAEVERVKQSAEWIKAPAAVPAEWKSASAVYENALAAKDAGEYEKASGLLDQAKTQFQNTYDVTLAKKQQAEKNILEAKNLIEELEAAVEQDGKK